MADFSARTNGTAPGNDTVNRQETRNSWRNCSWHCAQSGNIHTCVQGRLHSRPTASVNTVWMFCIFARGIRSSTCDEQSCDVFPERYFGLSGSPCYLLAQPCEDLVLTFLSCLCFLSKKLPTILKQVRMQIAFFLTWKSCHQNDMR